MWMFTWKFTLAPRQKKKKKKKKKKPLFAFRFSGHLPETNLFFFLALVQTNIFDQHLILRRK